LGLSDGDPGFAVIKPSGGGQTVALIRGGRILVKPKKARARFYAFSLGANGQAIPLPDEADTDTFGRMLDAFIATATRSLLNDTAGDVAGAREE
ncbi:MAG: LTA synthase family protein, partial [Candidatus Accumulibacter sp.]|jgi:hypothetical protein|nr:LTA synthase family protein [Accumulibacter sp.]